jgi:phosphoribosylformylglycinamidine synthase
MDVKAAGDSVYVVGETFAELGGSEYYKLKDCLGKSVPRVHKVQAKKGFRAVTRAIDDGLVRACHDLSEGGLAVAAAEMAFAGGYGLELNLDKVPEEGLGRDDFVLFSESNSRFLVEVSAKARDRFEGLMKGVVCAEVGRVTKSPRLCVRGLAGGVVVDALLSDLLKGWKSTLSSGV